MFTNNKLAKSVRLAIAIGAVSTVVPATQAFAAEDEVKEIEKIEVTGSRIKRTDVEATSPITTIGEAAIEITGVNNVAQLLNELPAAGIPGSVDTATNFRTSTTGLNTIDLRNLGEMRTLILVNGRRHVGGSAGSPTVDVSMIPVDMVKRVEVVTGGASAVYGSEAIAGVINFIMKDDFEGLEVNGRMGTSQEGGADESDFSIMAGANFADDKGNAVFYMGYSDRGILKSSDRDLSAHDANNSSFGPKGNFFGLGANNIGPVTGQDDDGNDIRSFMVTQNDSTGVWDKVMVGAEDGFDRNAVRLIRVPTERTQFNANITYNINDDHTFFSETAYNQLTSYSQLEPTIVGQFISVGASVPNIQIPVNNPFVPTELRDAVLAADPDAEEFGMRRRFVELGPRSSDLQRKVFRTAIGLEGVIADDYDYQVYYQYGNYGQDQTNGGVFNTLNFYNALRVEDDGNGGLQCSDEFARDLGCVPINVFGAGSIDGDALDWVKVDSQLTQRMEQEVIGASISGEAFELPAGAVAFAVGYEWRSEESQYISDTLAASGLTSGNTIPNTIGKYDVSEYFVEAIVPLLDSVPMAEYLGLELAYRMSDYSTIGSASSYKASLDWKPFDGLMVRGGISTAVRAPNIGELFDPGSETFRSFVDPCALGGKGGPSATGVEADVYQEQSAAVQANCAQIPGTATLDPFFNNIRSAGGLSAGNPDLKEETSETTTFGFVFSPEAIEGFSLTVDYFNITIEDAINEFTAQTTVDQCVRQSNFPNNPFCTLIERNPITGLVNRINAQAINVAEFESSGIDFSADYSMDLFDGRFSANLVGTYAMSNDFVPFTGGETVDSLGEIGVPELKVNANLTYSMDNLTVAWSTRYIDEVYVENDSKEAFGKVDSYLYHDLQVRYALGDEGQYEVYAGVDNLLDEEPPELGQGIPGDITGTNTAADVYDAIRRYYYAGFKISF